MALKKRERLLLLVTAVLLAMLLGYFVLTSLGSPQPLRDQHAQLTEDVEKQQRQVQQGQREQERLKAWEARSLPSDVKKAQSLYHDWLLKTAHEAGWMDTTVNAAPTRSAQPRAASAARATAARPTAAGRSVAASSDEAFTALRFTLAGEATLEHLTRFLHAFYASGYLHKITTLDLAPREEAGKLAVNLTIEALALPSIARADQLPDPPSELPVKEVDEYKKAIVDRNVFAFYHAPPPKPPEISPASQLYLSTVIAGDRPQAWLVKRQGNETLKLFEGATIPLAGHQAKLLRIGERDVEIEIDGKRWQFWLGDDLRKPVELPSSKPEPPADSPTPAADPWMIFSQPKGE